MTDETPADRRSILTSGALLAAAAIAVKPATASAQSGQLDISNTAYGYRSQFKIDTGQYNSALGYAAGYNLTTGSYNVAIGAGALATNATGQSSVAIGRNALNEYLGNQGVAVGDQALRSATGIRNIGLGASAGSKITTGYHNVFVGFGSGSGPGQLPTANECIVIGANAYSTGHGQIVLGSTVQDHLMMFGISMARYAPTRTNLVIGDAGASPATWTGSTNFGAGRSVFTSATTASSNAAFGHYAFQQLTTGNGNVAVGVAAGQFSQTTADSTLVGTGAARYATTGTGGTIVGYRALQHAASVGNNTCMGDSAFFHTQGEANIGIGYVVAEGLSQGHRNVAIGRAAMRYRDNGDDNVFIGDLAGAILANGQPGAPGETIGTAVYGPGDNAGGAAAGHRNVGVGCQALVDALGSASVGLGFCAGRSLVGTTAEEQMNVFIGAYSGFTVAQKANAINSTAIGYATFTDRDNQVVLGNASVTETVLRGVQRGTVYNVAQLPSAAVAGQGARAFVNDAQAIAFYLVVAGGGSLATPVFSDGAVWRVG